VVETGEFSVSFEDIPFFTTGLIAVFLVEIGNVLPVVFVREGEAFAVGLVREVVFEEREDFFVLLWAFGIVSKVENKSMFSYYCFSHHFQ
jgi:hypothetical protein